MRQKKKKTSEVAAPPGWLSLVVEKVDFEGAFQALEGYNHFHTETLRGKVRSLQVRTAEAWTHFEQAARLSRIAQKSIENRIRLFYLRIYSLDTAFIEEAQQESDDISMRTEREIQQLIEFDAPDEHILEQIRLNCIAFYQLVRGDYESSLNTFEALLDESKQRFEDQRVGFFCGAAAASWALGKKEEAWRHYENAAFGVAAIHQPLKVGLFAGQLYNLMENWGEFDAAQEWLSVLQRLPCSEESRECFIRRARVLIAASRLRNRIFVT